MEMPVRVSGDTSAPVVTSRPDSEAAHALKTIAGQLAARVSMVTLEQKGAPTINVI